MVVFQVSPLIIESIFLCALYFPRGGGMEVSEGGVIIGNKNDLYDWLYSYITKLLY